VTDEQREKKRAGLHPVLLRRIDRVRAAMSALGYPMEITDGLRTEAQQRALWDVGRNKPPIGQIVTNCDGVDKKSNHQAQADGYGHAVDLAFVDPHDPQKLTWDEEMPWQAYGECCRAAGLRWGIKLNASTIDRPHAELPKQV